ncbi:MAG TPA: hypothetical protein PLW75_05085, partial [Hyphomicrobium sp.]|nr:hypothetical protein [Hyphomicrobium sp.]
MTIAQETRGNFGSDYALMATWPVWIFSACIVALSFKQLRFGSFGGVVEWMTALIALVLLAEELRKGTLLQNRYIFGAAAIFAALSLGGIWAFFAEPQRVNLRETAAYVFAFLVVVAFLTLARGREAKALAILAVVISLYLALVAILAFVPNALQPAMWYHGVRLQGLSDNPNQIALLSLVALLLLAHAEMKGLLRRRSVVPLALVCALTGSLADSAAFVATIALATGILIVCAGFEHVTRDGGKFAKYKQRPIAFALACFLILGIFGHQFLPPVGSVVEALNLSFRLPVLEETSSAAPPPVSLPDRTPLANLVESEAVTGAVRVELWSQALSVGARSPLVGLGPGY